MHVSSVRALVPLKTRGCSGQGNGLDQTRDSNVILLVWRLLLGVWTVNSPQSHIVRVYDVGHGKVEFNILLSGMMAIGWAMESGRRGYGSSSG
ncbi:hypothetical protein TNCV_3796711 [Trichonephila clavipes]|nr:hypothetical protein TNCV_3796711 [Trichonephila clavipes]